MSRYPSFLEHLTNPGTCSPLVPHARDNYQDESLGVALRGFEEIWTIRYIRYVYMNKKKHPIMTVLVTMYMWTCGKIKSYHFRRHLLGLSRTGKAISSICNHPTWTECHLTSLMFSYSTKSQKWWVNLSHGECEPITNFLSIAKFQIRIFYKVGRGKKKRSSMYDSMTWNSIHDK